jgi:hypothetical protein
MGRFGYPSLRRQLAGLEPGSRRTVTIFQPVGCISVLRARSLPSSSNSVRSGSSTFQRTHLNRCWPKGLRGRSNHSTSPLENCEKADLQIKCAFATRCPCRSEHEVERPVSSSALAFGVRRFIGNVPFGIPLRKSALDNTSFSGFTASSR